MRLITLTVSPAILILRQRTWNLTFNRSQTFNHWRRSVNCQKTKLASKGLVNQSLKVERERAAKSHAASPNPNIRAKWLMKIKTWLTSHCCLSSQPSFSVLILESKIQRLHTSLASPICYQPASSRRPMYTSRHWRGQSSRLVSWTKLIISLMKSPKSLALTQRIANRGHQMQKASKKCSLWMSKT